jgi:hypothetical protein
MYKRIVLLVLATATGPTAAQQARPDPADPKAKVPAIEHRSAFEGYRSYAEPEVSRWREMNEEVGKVGGHLGIVRRHGDAAKPAGKPSASPAQGGHEGHK